ncbi:hypothetical protein [Nocardia sp. NPDC058633]|uniref:hypothetical protein n=1 Tax=Nocardia sp. NPDC058633 TaxID=3346568 RepID=UPI0036471F46
MTDTAVPMLWSGDLTSTLEFYRALGYTVVYEQTRPYTYGAVEKDGYALHFAAAPAGVELPTEHVGALVMVDDVAARHAEHTAALRAHYAQGARHGLSADHPVPIRPVPVHPRRPGRQLSHRHPA